eukprot:SAG11_NODE_371_length_10051_cov_5.987741_10_plen_91_part_00
MYAAGWEGWERQRACCSSFVLRWAHRKLAALVPAAVEHALVVGDRVLVRLDLGGFADAVALVYGRHHFDEVPVRPQHGSRALRGSKSSQA